MLLYRKYKRSTANDSTRHSHAPIVLTICGLVVVGACVIAPLFALPRGGQIAVGPVSTQHPTIGSKAPTARLADVNGVSYEIPCSNGRTTLLFFFCVCRTCVRMSQVWISTQDRYPDVMTYGVASIHPDAIAEFRIHTNIQSPLLFDANHQVARLYQSSECPRTWVVDKHGQIIYSSNSTWSVRRISDDLERVLGGRSPA
jgi:peroxiredoxin